MHAPHLGHRAQGFTVGSKQHAYARRVRERHGQQGDSCALRPHIRSSIWDGIGGVGRPWGRIECWANLPLPDSLQRLNPPPPTATSPGRITQSEIRPWREASTMLHPRDGQSVGQSDISGPRNWRPTAAPAERRNIMPPSCLSSPLHLFPVQVHRPPFTRHKPSTFLAPFL